MCLLVSSLGCAESVSEPVEAVATNIQVSAMDLLFDALGATTALTGTVLDQGGAVMAAAPIGWASSDGGVASISASGVVTAEGVGVATVTGTSGSATVEVPVTVSTPIDTVDVDARLYGSLLSGLRTLSVPLPAGTHTMTLIEGRFVGWSFGSGGAGTWRTHYRVYYPDSTSVDGGEALTEDGPDAAFAATTVRTMELTLPSALEIRIGVPDNVLGDNAGGVTLELRHVGR